MLRLVTRGGRFGAMACTPAYQATAARALSASAWTRRTNNQSGTNSTWAGWMTMTALFAGVGIADCSAEKPATRKWPVIARKEVEKHNSLATGVWVTYRESVFDITHFIANHPGGKDKLMSVAGQDIAKMWGLYEHHLTSPLAHELLEEMKIGELPAADVIIAPKVVHIPKYSNASIYDVIVVGAGLSGLKCAHSLVHDHGVLPQRILLLEAQDYIGGRVKQVTEFMKGTKIEVGAEFLHGNGTELTKFARENDEPLREIFCWSHGDGGPLDKAVDGGYGLYYVGASDLSVPTYRLPVGYADSAQDVARNARTRLLRYDDADPDFVALNEALFHLAELNENDFEDNLSLFDYLAAKRLNGNMLKMGEAGFANTLCANSDELSLRQAIKWSRIWHNEGEPGVEDGDYTFKNSYSRLVEHLKAGLQVELNSPVRHIAYPEVEAHTQGKGKVQDDGVVVVTTTGGVQYRAKTIVLTASPHVINSQLIQFSPPLPQEVQDAFSWVKMNSVTKVVLKFRTPVWPRDLHGMIMVGDDLLLPEVWFRNVEDEVAPDEPATAYAVGFTTSKYQEAVQALPQDEVLRRCVQQLETVFTHLEPKHMSADPADPANAQALQRLPKASQEFVGGMFWDWRPSHHPYIGGGYCSPLAGKPIAIGDVLKKGNGRHMFFAGEATNDRPGATAHAALETGIRAATQVADALQQKK